MKKYLISFIFIMTSLSLIGILDIQHYFKIFLQAIVVFVPFAYLITTTSSIDTKHESKEKELRADTDSAIANIEDDTNKAIESMQKIVDAIEKSGDEKLQEDKEKFINTIKSYKHAMSEIKRYKDLTYEKLDNKP